MTLNLLAHATRRLAVVILLAGFAAAAAPAHAQTGEDALRFTQRAPATGARMIGLGGAGIAGIGDYGALFTNPAGLGLLRHSELSGSLNALSTSDAATYRVPSAGLNSTTSDIRDTNLGNFAFLYKAPTAQGSLVFGIGYNQTNSFDRSLAFSGENATNSISQSFLPYADEFEVATDQNGNFYPRFFSAIPEIAYRGGAIEFLFENVGTGESLFDQAVVPGMNIEQFGDVIEEGRMSELSVGGAIEAARGVYVGAGANLTFGTYRFESLFEEADTWDEDRDAPYVVILDDGSELVGFDFLSYRQGFESDLTGFNVRAGLSAEVAPAVRVGLALETPTFFSVSETYHRNLETLFDAGGSLQDEERGSFEYEITTPWILGGGVAYSPKDLLLAADVEYVDWSQLRLRASSDDFADVNRDIRSNLEPVLNLRFGAEYRLGSVALRGGLALQPDPRKKDIGDESINRGKTYYSAGLSYHFSDQFAVDGGWMQARFDDRYQPYGDVDTAPPVVEESVVRNRFVVGLRIGF